MSLERLTSVVQPPLAPLESGTPEQWAAVERQLGTALPDDYKTLVDTYGTGGFNDFLWVLNPFARNEHLNLVARGQKLLAAYTVMRQNTPDELPYPTFPEQGGVLPWAITDNGDVLYWKTERDSSTWPVLLYNSRHWRHEEHNLPVTDFLAQVLSGALITHVFPDDLLEEGEEPYFEPRA